MCARALACGGRCCSRRRSCKRSSRQTARGSRLSASDGGRSGRSSKRDSYHEKRGGPLAGRKPPRRETQVLNVAEISRSRCQQLQQSSPRSATSVNPSAEAIFWTTFILPDTVASMPTGKNRVPLSRFRHGHEHSNFGPATRLGKEANREQTASRESS